MNALLERARAGEREALSALAADVRPAIERQLLRYPLLDEDRRDLVQATLLQVLRNIGAFRGDSTFSTWLFRVTANEALMLLRRQRRHRARLVEGLDLEELSSLSSAESAEREESDGAIAVHERTAWIADALDGLPERERELVVAHYHFDLGLQEIADRFELTEPTVRSRLHRARKHLRTILEHPPSRRSKGVDRASPGKGTPPPLPAAVTTVSGSCRH